MAADVKLLIDTNVFIPMEPVTADAAVRDTPEAMLFARLCEQTNSQVFVHPHSMFDIRRDGDESRRRLREVQFQRYPPLPQPPKVTVAQECLLGSPAEHSNDWVDNQLLAALKAHCADFLISNDRGVAQKARRLGIDGRVRSLSDAIQMLRLLTGEAPRPPPAVEHVFAHNLDATDPIFRSFREDYPGFDHWLDKCRTEHRHAWIIRGNRNDYAGVCIVNAERRPDHEEAGRLKICSFKVANEYAGSRFGELLLKTVFDYAKENRFEQLYLTVFEKYEALILLLETFGFHRQDKRKDSGELVLEKSMLATDRVADGKWASIGYNMEYGPYVTEWARNRAFFVPIRPEYHAKLFPEAERQFPLFDPKEAYGNSIRKAYLCNTSTRQLKRGDVLMFYRSADDRGVTVLGVLEDFLVSTDPAEITAFVGNRTVYNQDEIAALAESEVLALLFRHVRNLVSPLSVADLIEGRALRSAPQSIQQVRSGGFEWIRNRLMAP